MKHRGVPVRTAICDFLSKITHFSDKKKKKDVAEFLSDKNFPDLLKKLALSDKDKGVKIQGCKAVHAIKEALGKNKKLMKTMDPIIEAVSNDKRAKKNLEEAIKIYNADKAGLAGAVAAAAGGGDDDSKEDDGKKKKKGKGKGKKKKKGGGGGI